jgi:ATPase family associated with various cellular activities (AAA)
LSQIRTTYHTAIIGKKRTGKTTLARAEIEQLWLQGGWKYIYANTTIYRPHPEVHKWNQPHTDDCPLHPAFKRIRFLRELEEARYSIVFIDELSKAIPSRKVGHQNSEVYNLIQELMSNLGRWSCPLIYTDQWRRGADIMIRTNVDFLYQPAIMLSDWNHNDGNVPLMYMAFRPKTQEFWELEQPTEIGITKHTEMVLRDIFPLFRSEEAVPLTYNPPFEIDKWVSEFIEWCNIKKFIIKDFKISDIRNVIHTYMVTTRNYINSKEISAVLGKLKMDGIL